MKHFIQSRIFFLVAGLSVIMGLLHLLPLAPIVSYVCVFIASSLVFVFVCYEVLRLDDPPRPLIPLLLMLLAVRLSFLESRPVGSDDVYRYLWDGRVQTAGLNPYRYAPEDSALMPLHTADLPLRVNHPELKTAYFPLSEWAFYAAYQMSGEQVWGIRLLILAAELTTVWGLLLLLRELGHSAWRILLYAANPLVILQFSLDAHIDVLGFPFVVFALYSYLRKKETLAFVFLGFSLLVKPTMLVLLPILFLDQQGAWGRLKAIFLPLAIVALAFAPYAFSTNPFGGLSTFTQRWYFNGALFNLMLPLFSNNQIPRLVCLVVFVVALGFLLAQRRRFLDTAVLAMLLLILCSPVAHIWYIGWLIVLLPVVPISSGLVLAATASLPSFTFLAYQTQGVWKDYPLVLLLEYVPVVIFLWLDLRKETPLLVKR